MNISPAMSYCLLLSLFQGPAFGGDRESAVSGAVTNSRGVLVHSVNSPYQNGLTQIRVLLPDQVDAGRRYPVVYVLPVEAGRGVRWGDGLREVQQNELHNTHGAIFVAPTFSHLPWYADHPTDRAIRQETYFLDVVVPFVEKTYPVSTDSLLLGFSKSGWGAWSLLLRHPQRFDRAVAWDAPIMMQQVGKYGTSEIFGTQENFEKYRLADLLRANADALRERKRLFLTGYGNLREDHQQAHRLLVAENIPHEYRDGPQRTHDWHSGWLPEAVSLLFEAPQVEADFATSPGKE